MPKSDFDRLIDMLDYAERTVGIAQGRRREEIETDITFQWALLHGVQTIGEAAAGMSTEGMKRYASIPWKKIISMRNRLVHSYDSVDYDILWETVQTHIPELVEKLEKIIPPEQT